MKTIPNRELSAATACHTADLVCFSHLRWNFVYQRPQHLLSRFAKHRRVFYVEDPLFENLASPFLHAGEVADGLTVVVPHVSRGISPEAVTRVQRALIDGFFEKQDIRSYTLWYYTPMALAFSDHLTPDVLIYDCMDELSAFKFAPTELRDFENRLMERADVVFTGGQSLYEAKKHRHRNIHPFPSSIDAAHFRQARSICAAPSDQERIPRPRLGFFGVLDERLDTELLAGIADSRPDWHVVMIGPVVKIDPASLPKRPNIHYLGMKDYRDLPCYVAGWDVAILPFALNESTRFISPTKTPEYLAAGRPVVSTPIRDVIRPYGDVGLVAIAGTVPDFVRASERAMRRLRNEAWLSAVDEFLAEHSWDDTWAKMAALELRERNRRLSWSRPSVSAHEAGTRAL